MNRMRLKLMRFMQGRYGTDELNLVLLILAFAVDLTGMFSGISALMLVSSLILGIVLFRTLSRNSSRRAAENRFWQEKTRVPRRFFKTLLLGRKDRAHRYYLCPSCRTICRVPKGRGKLSIHCPSCGTSFDRKS